MDALPKILESMQIVLVIDIALAAIGFSVMAIMLARQSRYLAQGQAIMREVHALTMQTAASLENVTRLVVHPGGKTT